MQKDVHFYLTYALARKAGIAAKKAEAIAWADYFTDELTEPVLHEIQTQSEILGNWAQRQIQLSVLVPFHFIPGDDQKHAWMTTRNSSRARQLVDEAVKEQNPLRFGIALHTLQDTFSHEGFSGWQEDLNSCFPWYYIRSGIPNVGHAEMSVTPDVVNYVWTDPRDGTKIDNKERAMAAARETYAYLKIFAGAGATAARWGDISKALKLLFKLSDYDERVTGLCQLSGNSKIEYKSVKKAQLKANRSEFVAAASGHLTDAMDSLRSLI